jgi:hypothetical protein
VPAVPFVEILRQAGFTTVEGARRGRAHEALRAPSRSVRSRHRRRWITGFCMRTSGGAGPVDGVGHRRRSPHPDDGRPGASWPESPTRSITGQPASVWSGWGWPG